MPKPKPLKEVVDRIRGNGTKDVEERKENWFTGGTTRKNGCYGSFPVPTEGSEKVAASLVDKMAADLKSLEVGGTPIEISCAVAVASTKDDSTFLVAFSGEAAGEKGSAMRTWIGNLELKPWKLIYFEFASDYVVDKKDPGNVSCAEPKLFRSAGSRQYTITGMSVLWFSNTGVQNNYPLFPAESSSGTYMKPCLTCLDRSDGMVTGRVDKAVDVGDGFTMVGPVLKTAKQLQHFNNQSRTGVVTMWDPKTGRGFIKDSSTQQQFILYLDNWEDFRPPEWKQHVTFYPGKLGEHAKPGHHPPAKRVSAIRSSSPGKSMK